MPSDPDAKAAGIRRATALVPQASRSAWLRIPEALEALQHLEPNDAERITMPSELADLMFPLNHTTSSPGWEALASIDKSAPSDFAEVVALARALRTTLETGNVAEAARGVTSNPNLWRSALALAWPTLPRSADFASQLIAIEAAPGASLLANTLHVTSDPMQAAAALASPMGPRALTAVAAFLQIGELQLASALASALPSPKTDPHDPQGLLDSALLAQASGDLTQARQMLVDGWDRVTELGAVLGDRLADVALAERDPVSACEALKRALTFQPARERRARLAVLLADQGRPLEAAQWLATTPETTTEHIATAVLALEAGNHAQASAHLQEAVTRLASETSLAPSWLERLSLVAQKLEDAPSALVILDRLVHLRPEDPDLRARLAQHLLAADRPDAAAAHARALCDLQPESDDARRLLARACQAAGNPHLALTQWTLLAQPDPEDRLEAGHCALAAGRPDEAIRVARDVLLSAPGSARALTLLGQAHLAAGRPEEGITHLQAACAADPHQPEAWTAIAECQAATGDLRAAGNTLAAAVQAAPADGRLWQAYAAWLDKQGRTSEALEASARSLADASAPSQWRVAHAQLLTQMGLPEQAIDILRPILAQRPGAWQTRRALAEALLQAGRTSEAASVAGAVTDDAPETERLFAGRALALHASVAHDPALARRALSLLQGGAHESPSPSGQVWIALALETIGDFDQAYDAYRAALDASDSLSPDEHRQASLGFARCAIPLRRAPAAIHALERASRAHGDAPEVELALSMAYSAAGQYRRALEAAARAAHEAPDEASLRQLTQAAAQAGEIGIALDTVHKLIALDPGNPHAWLGLAELAAHARDHGQARDALAAGLRRAGQDATAWARASELLLRTSRPLSAQRALRRALTCSPQDPSLVRQMAEISQQVGDHVTAQRAWIRFGELCGDDLSGLKLAARSLSLLGQRAMAIGLWQRAANLDPHDIDTQSDLARAYLTEGEAPRALDLYRTATSASPDNPALALEAAAAELHYGSPETAVELFRQVTERSPQDHSAWQGLGETLLLLGRPQEARSALETAYDLDRTRVQTMAALAIACLDTDDAPTAAAMYQSAQRHTCEHAMAAAMLARAAIALLQWDEALTALDQVHRHAPSLASLRAGVELRLRMIDADWMFRAAAASAHAPGSRWSPEAAVAEVHALMDTLSSVAPSWEADRLRQRIRLCLGDADPRGLVSAARSDPSGETTEAVAIALLRSGRADEALSLVRPDGDFPTSRWHHLLAGQALTMMGRLQEGRESLHEAATDPALRPLAIYLAGLTHKSEGDLASFAEQASRALVEWSNEAAWHFELANAYLQLGQPDAALPHLHQASELAPQDADYHLALARAARQVGDPSGAQAAYARAVEVDPTSGPLWKEAAQCALTNHDEATAAAWFETARRLLPGDVETLIGSAHTCLATGEIREAHQHAQAAYHLAPDSSDVLQVLGLVFARQGMLDRALQSFDQALRRAEDKLPVHIARSRLLVQIGRGPQAVASLESAIAQSPESDVAWSTLAEIREACGDLPKAIEASERAVQLAPRDPGHRVLLGRLSRKSGQLDRALDELLRAQAFGRGSKDLYLELGRVHEERREYKRSLDAYQRVIDIDPLHGEAHYRAGVVFRQIKAYPQAGKMLKRAVELNPRDPEALHQLAAVRALELVHGGIVQQVGAP